MKPAFLALILGLLALALTPPRAAAAAKPDFGRMSTAELIDALQDVSTPTVGLGDAAWFGGFIADPGPLRFEGGRLGVPPPPAAPQQMRELVRRGPAALSALLDHLDDARPSGLVLGVNNRGREPGSAFGAFMGASYSEDYQPRRGPPRHGRERWVRPFEDVYRVRVGDICFVLLGQIVNRSLTAARYQPTAVFVVNSPVESPILAQWAREDWRSIDADGLRASLLADLHDREHRWRNAPAQTRLRFYFPSAVPRNSGGALPRP